MLVPLSVSSAKVASSAQALPALSWKPSKSAAFAVQLRKPVLAEELPDAVGLGELLLRVAYGV